MLLYQSKNSINQNTTQTTIQGANVFLKGKTDFENLEIDDIFSYITNDKTRYIVGKIVSLPIDFEIDIDNENKIIKSIDNKFF
jgi:hypothetical protein